MSPAVALQELGFVYPDGHRVLATVDLAIGAGETIALVGQNGSGKSTLVRHLNGLLRPTEGRVLLDGRDIAGVPVASLAAHVGLLFQNPDRQLFEERVGDEVAFGPRNLGRRGDDLETVVADALEAVGLSGLDGANPFVLGQSRRKLVALASILAMRTPIVVLDEPTTGQDARGIERIRSIVRGLAAEGRTTIAISHDLRFVAETFDRVVILCDGTVALDGTPAEVFGPQAGPVLAAASLEPPPAARVGMHLGLGATPTEADLVARLAARAAAER
ncbi:MAG: energy-coupling factor ABC transporter ATP-binding protein [Candidatus Limnocylindrales bacterium]